MRFAVIISNIVQQVMPPASVDDTNGLHRTMFPEISAVAVADARYSMSCEMRVTSMEMALYTQ
jgi:hypothetical protein